MNIELNGFMAVITVENNRDDILLFHIINVVNDEELERFFPAIANQIMKKSVVVNFNVDLTTAELKEYDIVASIILNLQRNYEAHEGKVKHLFMFNDKELDLLFKYARVHLSGHEKKAESIWRKFIQEVKNGIINDA